MIFNPEEAVYHYRELGEALGKILQQYSYYEDEELNLLKLNFEFDPKQFDRLQIVKLLRANSILQAQLERLSSIIEYVPYIFRKNNLYL